VFIAELVRNYRVLKFPPHVRWFFPSGSQIASKSNSVPSAMPDATAAAY